MNTRIKTVYLTSEIPHLWAHQSVGHARNKQGNLWFDGPLLFSYNTVIAVRIDRKGAQPLFVMDNAGFSMTTSKHQYAVRRAVYSNGDALSVRGLDEANPRQRGWELRLAASLADEAAAKYTEAARHRDGSGVQASKAALAQEWAESAHALLDRVKRGKGRAALARALSACCALPTSALTERAARLRTVTEPRRRAALTASLRMDGAIVQDTTRSPSSRLVAAHRVRSRIDELLAPVWSPATNDYRTPRLPRGVPSREAIDRMIVQLRDEDQAARQAQREKQLHDAWREAELYMHKGSYRAARNYANQALQLCASGESWPRQRVDYLLTRASRKLRAERVLSQVAELERLDAVEWGEYRVGLYASLVADVADWPPGHPMRARVCALKPKASEAAQALAAKRARQVDDWRAGARVMVDSDAPLLRLRENVIETSWGARVPAESARRLWALLVGLRGRDAQCASLTERLVAQGYRVGNYPLADIRSDGSLKIGCHDIAASEVDYIAKQLGLV